MNKYRKYYTGRYGLVDKTNCNIWLNIDDEQLAHDISRVFVSKIGLLVFDLTIFENFVLEPPTVDSDVCLDWYVAPALNIDNTCLSIYDHPNVETINQYHTTSLLNRGRKSLLTLQQQLDLQEQMMFYAQLRQARFLNSTSQQVSPTLKKIDSTFQTEINTELIEKNLIVWARENSKDNVLNLHLLNFFNQLYA